MFKHLNRIAIVPVLAFGVIFADLTTAQMHSHADAGIKDFFTKKKKSSATAQNNTTAANTLGVTTNTVTQNAQLNAAAPANNFTVSETYSSAGLISGSSGPYSSLNLTQNSETINASTYETVNTAAWAQTEATLSQTAASTALHNHANGAYGSLSAAATPGPANYEQPNKAIAAEEAEVFYGSLAQQSGQQVIYEQLLPTSQTASAANAGAESATATTAEAQAAEASTAQTVSAAEGVSAQFKSKLEAQLARRK